MAKIVVDGICRLFPNKAQVYITSLTLNQAMNINLSMLLDRPPHVQGRLCNIPPLSEADFDQVSESQETDLNEANTFAINAVQLARTGSTSIILF